MKSFKPKMLTKAHQQILMVFISFLLNGVLSEKEINFDFNIGENKKIVNIQGNSSYIISIYNIPSSVSALLFGTHSHISNITLSEEEEECIHCSVTGKNIGLVYKLSTWESQAHIRLINTAQKNFSVLVTVSALSSDGPIPGACNMEFPTEIAPYMRLRFDSGRTYLEYQHANIGASRDDPAPLCSVAMPYISYDVYVSYLKENDFGEEEYFNKINSMSNISLIKQSANKVQSYSVHPDTRLSFLMYPNIGVVYNIIAKYTVSGVVKQALYVPVVSYGCGSSEFTQYGCNFSYAFEGKALLFLLSMYGFFTAFFGHLFYGSTMFFFGFVSTIFICIILIARFSDASKNKVVNLSIICGLMGGIIWFLLYYWLHTTLISVLLVGFVFGFMLTATVLYSPVGNYEINLNDKNYWLILTTGCLLTTAVFLAYPTLLSILSSSIVGSYVMLLFYDDFIGTRLSYIILNIIKRALSKNLEFAANDLPFQIKDAMICVAWVLLSIFAVIIQFRSLEPRSWNSTKINCCRSKKSNYDEESDPHQPLRNNSLSYNTFSY